MSGEVTWFDMVAQHPLGNLHIRGVRIGTAMFDGSYAFEIQVKGKGLSAVTTKSFNLKDIRSFIDGLRSIHGRTDVQILRLQSLIVPDFYLSAEVKPRLGACHVHFKLCHGNVDQWHIEFDSGYLVSSIQAEIGE